MKVFFPIGSFYPSQTGGPNNTIFWMSKAMMKEGLDITIVSTNQGINDDLPKDTWLEKDYGKVIYTKTLVHYLPFRLLINSFRPLINSDIVHLTALFYPGSFISAILCRIFGKKIVWSTRGELDDQALVYSYWKKAPVLWFIKAFLSHKVVFHGTADTEVNFIKKTFGKDVKVIQVPNYLEIPTLVSKNKEKYFLFIGRIHPKKAIENLIEGLILSKEFLKSDFNLRIAGDYNNPYGLSLKTLVAENNLKDRIEFLGQIEGIEKQEILAKAYFSFMPSHTENFGNVVIEALAQKTPVVASKGTPWELLNEYNAGFWTGNSKEELALVVDEIILMKEEEYLFYSENALKLVTKKFDIKKNVEEWIYNYNQILNNKF